jgi:predicted RecB family endonuclease
MKLKEKVSQTFNSEQELVSVIVGDFLKRNLKVITEVQLFERYIDVFAYDTNRHYAIEVKLKSPYNAFKQALRYRIISDYTYVAVPKNSTNNTAIRLAQETGIGLILVTKKDNSYYLEVAVESVLSGCKDDRITDYIVQLAN